MNAMNQRRAKILFVMPHFEGGGAERVALTLLAGLNRSTFEPHLSVLETRGPLQRLLGTDVILHGLGHRRLRDAVPTLILLIRRERPDVIFATHSYINIILLALKRMMPPGTKLVLRESSTPSLSLPNKPRSRFMTWAYRKFYPSVDLMICQHRLTEREMAMHFGVSKDKIVSLPNPVDLTALRSAASTPQRVDGNGLRFVAAGRLSREKGFDRLIALFAEMPRDSHLTIHGDGPEIDLLTKQIEELDLHNRVTLAGFTENLAAVLAGADACLVSSHWEGLPNVALEALAVGTPVVATPESGGIAELASAAVSEAVVIAAWGNPFAKAMLQTRSHFKSKPAPSLLPAKYVAENVSATFNAKLRELLAFPATVKDNDIASRARTQL